MVKPTLENLEQFRVQKAVEEGKPEEESIENNNENFIDKFTKSISNSQLARDTHEYVAKPVRALTGGLAQGIANLVPSVLNTIPEQFGKSPFPYVDIRKQSTTGEPNTDALFTAGEIGSGYSIPGGAYLKGIRGSKGAELLDRLLSGAGLGYVTGATHQDNEQQRLLNSFIGGALAPLHGLTNKSIAQETVKQQQYLKPKFAQEYNDILAKADQRNSVAKVPESLLNNRTQDLFREIDAPQLRVLKDFLQNPTFKSGHSAQTELFKIREAFKKLIKENSATERQKELYHKLQPLREDIRESIKESVNPELARKYQNITESYAKHYVPYRLPEIESHAAGETSARNVYNAMLREANKTGNLNHYKEIPGFKARQAFSNLSAISKALIGLGAGGLAGGVGYEFGIPGIRGIKEALEENY